MKMFVFVFVLNVLLAVGQSAKIDGPCPIKIKQIETFDPNRYCGKWWDTYTSSNYYTDCGSDSGCQLSYYRDYDEDKHVFLVNYYMWPLGYHIYTGFCLYSLWQTDYDVDARLFYDAEDDIGVYVLDTDYDSYAVEIGCANDDGLTHEEKVVLRSRNITMSDEVRDRLVKKVVEYGFAEPNLVAHNFTGCSDYDPVF